MKTQSFVLSRLRGVDLRYQVSPDSAADIQDMTWTLNDSWASCGGYRPITVNSLGYAPWTDVTIDSLHWFSQHNGARQWLLWEDSAGRLRRFWPKFPHTPYIVLYDRDGNRWDGEERARYIHRTPSAGTQSAVWGGRMYLVNGQDEPIVFDGRVTGRAGYIRAPSPPSGGVVFRGFSTTSTSYWLGTRLRSQGLGSSYPFEREDSEAGDAKLCAYKYKVTFVNRRGQESPMSEPSNLVQFECGDSGKKRFVHLSIPVGDSETVARRLYRTRDVFDEFGHPVDRSYGYNYYFLKEVQDNVTEYIEDGISDSNLGSLTDPEDFGPWPSQAKFIGSFKNTLFLAGMPNNQIRFSAPNMPEVFPDLNLFDISEGDGGDITGMYPTKNAMVVFKRRGIYLIKGDPSRGFYVQTLTKDIGCIAADSVAEVPGVGLVFLSESGIYALEGALENTGSPTAITEISVPIRQWFDDLSDSALAGAIGVVYHRDREFWLCVPALGDVYNTMVLVFHYSVGSWSRRFDFPVRSAVETKDHRGYLFFGSGDSGNRPGVYVYTHSEIRLGDEWGTPVTAETASSIKTISPIYKTAPLNFGGVYSGVHPAYVNIYAVAHGSNGLSLNLNVNRSIDRSFESPKTRKQQHLIDPLDSYGDDLYYDGDTEWGYYRPTPFRYDVSLMHESLTTELQLTFTPSDPENPHIEIIGFDVEAKVGAQRDVRILTDALTADRR
jgi:hypothetical protein